MARKKAAIQPFDFSDFFCDTDKLTLDKYKTDADILARLEFIDKNKEHGEYYLKRNIQFMKNGDTFQSFNKWTKRNILQVLWKYEDTLQQQETVRFREWYDKREDAQQAWRECWSSMYGLHSWQGYFNNGTYSAQETRDEWAKLETAGPSDPCMWDAFLCNYAVKSYVELHRNPKYEIGDLVLLRKAYVSNWRYDPDTELDVAVPRLGTIMGYKDETGGKRKSSSSAGSRTVSVLWLGKNDIIDVMEKTIKLECRKGHKMGKV